MLIRTVSCADELLGNGIQTLIVTVTQTSCMHRAQKAELNFQHAAAHLGAFQTIHSLYFLGALNGPIESFCYHCFITILQSKVLLFLSYSSLDNIVHSGAVVCCLCIDPFRITALPAHQIPLD